jgi:hypothetical protein
LLPVTLTENCCACPTVTVGVEGFTATTTRMLSVTAFEAPPPGAGVVTVTGKLPAFANCAAVSVAVNCVVLPYVVASAVLPNSTLDCVVNPLPVTVRVAFPLPALTVAGEIELIAGTGSTIVTEAVAEAVELPTLAAVIVTVLGVGSAFGAV